MLLNKIQGDQNATEQDNQAYVQQQCEQNNKYICILANIYRRPRGFAGTFICRLAAIIFIVFCIRGLPVEEAALLNGVVAGRCQEDGADATVLRRGARVTSVNLAACLASSCACF
eukprot:scpid54582/ scgid25660/ 